ALVLTACSKEDEKMIDDDKDGNAGAILLVTEMKINGKTSVRYEFDAKNRLTVLRSYNNEGMHSSTATYTYDNQDRLSVITNAYPDGSTITKVEYTYAEGDKPISAVTTSYSGSVVQSDITYDYTDNKMTETISMPPPVPDA